MAVQAVTGDGLTGCAPYLFPSASSLLPLLPPSIHVGTPSQPVTRHRSRPPNRSNTPAQPVTSCTPVTPTPKHGRRP
jgi:hypothetical protein